MITDLMRNDLSRVCRPGTVRVEQLLELQRHPGVWHLVSTVAGDLRPGTARADLLRATFPPGSVTGAPKSARRRASQRLEPQARGAYTGALGFLSPTARRRTQCDHPDVRDLRRAVELGVGGGITVDSVPIREWYECLHKADRWSRRVAPSWPPSSRHPPPPYPERSRRRPDRDPARPQRLGAPARRASGPARSLLPRALRAWFPRISRTAGAARPPTPKGAGTLDSGFVQCRDMERPDLTATVEEWGCQ